MREKEKRPSVAPLERLNANNINLEDDNLLFHSIFNKFKNQHQIICYLYYGRDSARSALQISKLIQGTSRDVSRAIERARKAGAPICASIDGYYLPQSFEELDTYLSSFDRRLKNMRKTRACMDDILNKITGQEVFTNAKTEDATVF